MGRARRRGHLAHAQHRPHHLAADLYWENRELEREKLGSGAGTEVGTADLVHAAGHGSDQSLVTEVLMKALQVDLPVNAVVRGSLGGTRTESEGKGGRKTKGNGAEN